VQSELSLDSVKVVHNDLSDADVEVVPIKSRTAARSGRAGLPPAKKILGISGRADVSRNAWINQRKNDAQCQISFTNQ
jgi:hypothetical protein